MNWSTLLAFVQFLFIVVIGLYFWGLLRNQQGSKVAVQRESRKEVDRLRRLREISLTEPLAERTRPRSFVDVVGQAEGCKALRAALCSPNPQHVLLYGPPGVGKTAAARLILEEARRNPQSPFLPDAAFVEIDATTARFDERGIADPLIGSVHDPIYQGAGPLGIAGIPQPKPGAVTRAHGGVLFIDEIGELHPVQMNKLLKVLEDRRVMLESAYYNPEDPGVPRHIRDVFENGLPADFRLVGATTRSPEELPPAIRSRCLEIFFRALQPEEVERIAAGAVRRVGFEAEDGVLQCIRRYAQSGREAVNIVQLAAGITQTEGRATIQARDAQWVVRSGQYTPRYLPHIPGQPQIGVVNALAIAGPSIGYLMEVEATVRPARPGGGRRTVTGMVEEEEMGGRGHTFRRKSTAKGSLDNVFTVLERLLPIHLADYDLHVNFPGGSAVDGPSAGVSMAVALYSALTGTPVDNTVAMTGELTLNGAVKPVGGTFPKVEAARRAGVHRVLVPEDNWEPELAEMPGITVTPIASVQQAISASLALSGLHAVPPLVAGTTLVAPGPWATPAGVPWSGVPLGSVPAAAAQGPRVGAEPPPDGADTPAAEPTPTPRPATSTLVPAPVTAATRVPDPNPFSA